MFLFFLPYSTTLSTDEKCKTYFTYPLGLDKKKQITFKISYKKLYEFILCIVLKKINDHAEIKRVWAQMIFNILL